MVVAGDYSARSVLSNMVYQGTVWGPTLWNAFIGDASLVFVSAGYCIVIYADDLNAFKAYDRSISNAGIFADLQSRQIELHTWGRANRVTFDAGKEHFSVLSTTDAAGDNFKVLGIEFESKLSMVACIQTCVHEAAWRYRSLRHTHRFFTDAELLGLFKANVFSFF